MSSFLTIAEAAKLLRFSNDYTRDLCRDGTLPSVQLTPGGRYLIPKHELFEVLKSSKVEPKTEPLPQPERLYVSTGICQRIARMKT